MKTVDQVIDNFTLKYPLSSICAPEKALFIDIETTGFTARSSMLYMIGCAYLDATEKWHTLQWMAEAPDEQITILQAFFDFVREDRFLIHFNGTQFDLTYLRNKCEELELLYSFDAFEGLDLYRRISPCKRFLNLVHCKQKSIEEFLGIHREDLYTGGDLIAVYQDYLKNPTAEACDLLLLHNRDDLIGMLSILPVLSYSDALTAPLKAKKVQANHYRDMDDIHRMELLITVSLPHAVPVPLTVSADGCFCKLDGEEAVIRVPVYEETLKYFYSNYKDYYYLPEEDLALHKSVATFVDKEHRVQATAQTCYTRKNSTYLRQWDYIFAPFFKRDYKSPELFFELTDEMKKNRSAFAVYASHILNMVAKHS